jgi:hypothetical protein
MKRLTRCFGDHFVIRCDRTGKKLVYPLLVAFSPRLRTKAASRGGFGSRLLGYTALRLQLPPLTTAPTP